MLVIWLSVSWSRPAIKTSQSPLSDEAKNQPVNEDFDLQGCELLALFSIRLSNAAICLQKVKLSNINMIRMKVCLLVDHLLVDLGG